MINIYFYRTEDIKCSFYKMNFLKQLIKIVEISNKLEKVFEVKNADIIFTIADYINDIQIAGKKIVVYSLQDNSFTDQNIILNKNVLFILDHYKIITENEEYNKKVFCLLNISNLYKKHYSSEVLPLSEREYDVVFMGTTQYDEKITKHRLDVIQHIEDVCSRNNLKYFISNKPIKYVNYINILNNTKIFISPYGWGEFSLKEYECICVGTHTVKPKINFQYYPNYCDNMDDFEMDFSNFESKILNILANLSDSQKKVDSNRNMFLKYSIFEHCVELENKIFEMLGSDLYSFGISIGVS
jgi:hypothetical protein